MHITYTEILHFKLSTALTDSYKDTPTLGVDYLRDGYSGDRERDGGV